MNFDLNERESFMLDKMAEEGSLSVADLARELNVSAVTIRSDLKNLEEKRLRQQNPRRRLSGFLQGHHRPSAPQRGRKEQDRPRRRLSSCTTTTGS